MGRSSRNFSKEEGTIMVVVSIIAMKRALFQERGTDVSHGALQAE